MTIKTFLFLDMQEKIELLLNERKIIKDELEYEQQQIMDSSAKFAIFLEKNSFAIYNDITETYLNTLIDLERKRVNVLKIINFIININNT